MSKEPGTGRPRGFTLIEVLLAVVISATVITSVLTVFEVTLFAREEVKALAEPMATGPRVLDMIEEDIHNVWTYNIEKNRVLIGRDKDILGVEADRIHMIVAGRSTYEVRLENNTERSAPYSEVSYMLKTNPEQPELVQLWRREDPLIDEDMTRGGHYQLLTSRVRSFNVSYYEGLGREAEQLDDWDTEEQGALPRRIKIELELERHPDTFNILSGTEVSDIGSRVLKYTRFVVLPPVVVNSLAPGVAVIPSVPETAPVAEDAAAAAGVPAGMAGRGDVTSVGAGGKRGDRPGGRPGGRPGVPGKPGATPLPFPKGGAGGNLGDLLNRIGGSRGGSGKGGGKGR